MRTMKAYKLFKINKTNGKTIFRPWFYSIRNLLYPYDTRYIIQRPYDCGPFACFKTIRSALNLDPAALTEGTLYLVKILPSKDKKLWIAEEVWPHHLPRGTILADEFEVLKKVTTNAEQ